MKIFKFTFLLLIIISCKQTKNESKRNLELETPKVEIVNQEKKVDSTYELYKKGEVESFDWNLVWEKAKKYRSISEKQYDKALIPNDFLKFGKRFISDSKFQKEHIDFENLIAVVGACEETYLMTKNNWVFDDWNFIENIKIDNQWENTFRFSDQVFFCEYKLKEIGTIRILGFEKQNGIWRLTLYDHSDC